LCVLVKVDMSVQVSDLRELDVDSLLTALKPATSVGRDWLRTRLSTPTTDVGVLQSRQETIRAVKRLLSPALLEQRSILAKTEASVQSLAEAADDERHAEFYNQLMWSPNSIAAKLNTWGWLTELIVAFRSFLLPAFSVLMPILLFLAPIVSMMMSGETVTVARYARLLQTAIQKSMPSTGAGAIGRRFTTPLMSMAEQIVSVGASLMMLVVTAWTQVSTGRAVQRAVTDMRAHATSVQKSEEAVQTLVRILRAGGVQLESPDSPGPWSDSTLSAFGEAWNSSARVRAQLAQIGELDGLLSLASVKRTCFPTFSDSFTMTDFWHPELTKSKSRVYNSIDLKKHPHVLLTGPNRGGKTTVLKSLGVAVLMAQSVGIVFARRATLPLFGAIRTSLRPVDALGSRSLFETEIDFACEIQDIKVPLFLIMDEIFHGTNARDGVAAAEVFLDRLYSSTRPIVSLISTHYSELPARYSNSETSQVQTLCMDAHEDPTDPVRILSSYRIRKGVNCVSSVREILRERGLLSH